MKQFIYLFLAALIGGIAAAALVLSLIDGPPTLALQPSPAPAAAPVLVAEGSNAIESLVTPIDLRPAARLAIPAVVHIKAYTKGRQREAVKALFSEKERTRRLRDGEGSGLPSPPPTERYFPPAS